MKLLCFDCTNNIHVVILFAITNAETPSSSSSLLGEFQNLFSYFRLRRGGDENNLCATSKFFGLILSRLM